MASIAEQLDDSRAPDRAHHEADAARPGVGATDLLLLLMAVIWGVNFTVVKYGTQWLPPLAFNGIRVSLAAAALFGIGALARKPWPSRRDFLALAGLGVIGNGFYQILFVEGVSRTRAGDAALVIAASPALIALLGRLTGVERVSRRGVVGIALSIAGIALVVFGAPHEAAGSAAGRTAIIGDLLVLGAALCWAVYNILLKRYTDRVDGVQLSAVTMLGGAVVLAAAGAPAIATASYAALPPLAWGAVLYSGLLALVVAYLFWYRGVRVLGPTRAAMYSNLQPVIALLVAWALLGETPGLVQIGGTAAIMLGLVLTRN